MDIDSSLSLTENEKSRLQFIKQSNLFEEHGVIKNQKYREWLSTFEIIFDEVTPIGEVKFYFTEPLKAIEELGEGLNLTAISEQFVFNLRYQTYVNDSEEE